MTKTNELLVSVVIPTYNRTDFFSEALNSVLGQTYKNIEIIVVDDNVNKPEVRRFVEGKVANIPQCILVQNEKNLGGALNRNEGIKHSKGELISFLDDDDVYAATRIEKVVDMYLKHQNEKIGVIYTYCYLCNADLSIKGDFCRKTDKPLYFHMCECLCATSQWTIPSRVFKEVGVFEQSPCKQDSILLLKILGAGYDALCVEERLSYFRTHSGVRISGRFDTHVQGELNLLNWMRKYYHYLSTEEIKNVEVCASRRLLFNYVGMGERRKGLNEFFNIIKNGSFPSLLDCFYIIFGVKLYLKLKNLVKSLMKCFSLYKNPKTRPTLI